MKLTFLDTIKKHLESIVDNPFSAPNNKLDEIKQYLYNLGATKVSYEKFKDPKLFKTVCRYAVYFEDQYTCFFIVFLEESLYTEG